MTTTPKKKLCWNCEGRVSLEEENCPYCAVYLGPAPDENGESKDILAPPYRIVETDEENVPPSPYKSELPEEQPAEEETTDLTVAKKDTKEVVLPLALLSAGSLFFLFGLILLLFSEHGVFTLTWNGEYWYFYLIFALPMLFFGWRALQKFDNEDENEGYEALTQHQNALAEQQIQQPQSQQEELF